MSDHLIEVHLKIAAVIVVGVWLEHIGALKYLVVGLLIASAAFSVGYFIYCKLTGRNVIG